MLLEDAGTLLEDAGALLEDAGALLEEDGALLEEAGALLEDAGALLEEDGALLLADDGLSADVVLSGRTVLSSGAGYSPDGSAAEEDEKRIGTDSCSKESEGASETAQPTAENSSESRSINATARFMEYLLAVQNSWYYITRRDGSFQVFSAKWQGFPGYVYDCASEACILMEERI